MNHPIDQIEPYITGGLTADERVALEAHVAECPACAIALEEAQSADAAMNDLFAAARPAAGFEDRMIAALRRGGHSRLRRALVHPMVRRVAMGMAASPSAHARRGCGVVGSLAVDASIGGRQSRKFSRTSRQVSSPSSDASEAVTPLPRLGIEMISDGASFHVLSRVIFQTKTATRGWKRAICGQCHDVALPRATSYRLFNNSNPGADGGRQTAASGGNLPGLRLEEERHSASVELGSTLSNLRSTAIDLTKHANYQQAVAVVDQILQLDPNDTYAPKRETGPRR